MKRRARTLGLLAVALCCTCTGLQLSRAEPHPSHAAAFLALAAITFFAAVLIAVALLSGETGP